MNNWTITNLELKPPAPEILASTADARAIVLLIPAGESLDDHQVHERAWLTVIEGEVEIATGAATLDPADLGSGDAAAYGLDSCLDAVVEVELGEDAGDVVVDGVGAERKLVRYVVIALAAGEPFEDL